MYCVSTSTTNYFDPIIHSFVAFKALNKPYNSSLDCEYLEICSFYTIDPNLAGCRYPSASTCAKMNPTTITDVSMDRITSNGKVWSIGQIATQVDTLFFISSIANLCFSPHLNSLFVTLVNFVKGFDTSAKLLIQFCTVPAISKNTLTSDIFLHSGHFSTFSTVVTSGSCPLYVHFLPTTMISTFQPLAHPFSRWHRNLSHFFFRV